MRKDGSLIWRVALAVALAVGAPGEAAAQGGGSIVGEVRFTGTPPEPKVLKVNKDNQACGNEQKSEELVVSPNKGVPWAVVSVAGAKGPAPKPGKKPVVEVKAGSESRVAFELGKK